MSDPTFYAIIPASVRYSDIESGAKLLYGEITALCNREGYCFAHNSYFKELYKVEERTIQRWLKSLIQIQEINIEIENNYTRKIFLCNVGQKGRGGMTKMTGGYDKNDGIYNNTINNTINTSPPTPQITEEEKKDIFCISIEEFKSFINEGKNKELYPWRDFEKNVVDCWLFYELNGKRIKKLSAELVFSRWQTGGKKEIRDEEKKNWEQAQKKKSLYAPIDEIEEEKKAREFKKQQGIRYIEENPGKSSDIDALANEKALVQAKGNKDLATRLKPYIYYTIAYEMSMKEKIGQNIDSK